MHKKRHHYRRKRSSYRKFKSKMNNQLAWEEEERTHSKLYNITLYLLLLVSAFGFYNSNNLIIGIPSGIFLMVLLIVVIENKAYSLHTERNKKGQTLKIKTVLWILALKEIFISYIFVLIIFLVINVLFELTPLQLQGKNGFNILIILTLLTSFFGYYFYTKYELNRKLFQKTAKKEKRTIKKLNKEEYREFFLNTPDLFAIFATILLLSNSTASLLYPVEVRNLDELLYTFEFKVLLYILANYMPAIYLRIPK